MTNKSLILAGASFILYSVRDTQIKVKNNECDNRKLCIDFLKAVKHDHISLMDKISRYYTIDDVDNVYDKIYRDIANKFAGKKFDLFWTGVYLLTSVDMDQVNPEFKPLIRLFSYKLEDYFKHNEKEKEEIKNMVDFLDSLYD